MIQSLLLVLVGLAGCFSEPATTATCTPGEPGCDCNADGTCGQGSECVASIDKCVPSGCTPGSRTCTCAEDMQCLGELTCPDGVCIDPPEGTSGNPTNASTSPSTTAAMTSPPETDTAADSLMPTDTTDASASITASSTAPETSDATMSTDTGPVLTCTECLMMAADMCPTFPTCAGDVERGGCYGLYSCVLGGAISLQECCTSHSLDPNHVDWQIFVECAEDFPCAGACAWGCTD